MSVPVQDSMMVLVAALAENVQGATSLLQRVGTIESVVSALNLAALACSESLAKNAGCAIWNLCDESNGSRPLADAGAATAAIKVLRAMPTSALAQHWGCGTLAALAKDNSVGKMLESNAEVEAAVRSALDAFRTHNDVKKYANMTLRRMQRATAAALQPMAKVAERPTSGMFSPSRGHGQGGESEVVSRRAAAIAALGAIASPSKGTLSPGHHLTFAQKFLTKRNWPAVYKFIKSLGWGTLTDPRNSDDWVYCSPGTTNEAIQVGTNAWSADELLGWIKAQPALLRDLRRRLKEPAKSTDAPVRAWAVGDRVWAQYNHGKKRFLGTVTVDLGALTYRVDFDDKDVRMATPAKHMFLSPRLEDEEDDDSDGDADGDGGGGDGDSEDGKVKMKPASGSPAASAVSAVPAVAEGNVEDMFGVPLPISDAGAVRRSLSQLCPRSEDFFKSKRKRATPPTTGTGGTRKHLSLSERTGNAKLSRTLGQNAAARKGAAGAAAAARSVGSQDQLDHDEDDADDEGGAKPPVSTAPLVLLFPTKSELASGHFLKVAKRAVRADELSRRHDLLERYRAQFASWSSMLRREGFHLLFYGFGSKHDMLDEFRRVGLAQSFVVEVKGWQQHTTVDALLRPLAELVGGEALRHDNSEVFARRLVDRLGPRRRRWDSCITWNNLVAFGGWTHTGGHGLVSHFYLRPGAKDLAPSERQLGVHQFADEASAVAFAQQHQVNLDTRLGHVDEPPPVRPVAQRELGAGVEPAARAYAAPLGPHGIEAHEVIVLLIHSLDGSPHLRTARAMATFAALAACPRLCLVASVDHANAPLLWGGLPLRWTWLHTPTLAEFDREASHLLQRDLAHRSGHATSGAKQGGSGGSRSAEAVRHVLETLTERHVKLLQLLAKHADGLSELELLREATFVAGDAAGRLLQLRKLLVDPRDHRLVVAAGGRIRIDPAVLNPLAAMS